MTGATGTVLAFVLASQSAIPSRRRDSESANRPIPEHAGDPDQLGMGRAGFEPATYGL